MSANKIKHEFRTILNFGKTQMTKHKIAKMLKETNMCSCELLGDTKILIGHQINLGVYTIRLEFSRNKIEKCNPEKLTDYGNFNIRIYENDLNDPKEINLKKHCIFKNNKWVQKNLDGKLRINDLVEIIHLCIRLNLLKVFN